MKHSVVKQQGVASIFFVLSLSAILAVNFFAFQSLVRINKQVRLGDASEAAALALTEISDFQLAQAVGVVDIPYPDQGQAETYAAAYVREYMGTTGTATTVSNINVVRSLPNRKHISYTVTPTVTDTEIFPDMWSIQNDNQAISNQGKAAKGFQGPINVAFVTDFSGSMRPALPLLKGIVDELMLYLDVTQKGSKVGLYPFNTGSHPSLAAGPVPVPLPIREFAIPIVPTLIPTINAFMLSTFPQTGRAFYTMCVEQPLGTAIPNGPGLCPEPMSAVAKGFYQQFTAHGVTAAQAMTFELPDHVLAPKALSLGLGLQAPALIDGVPPPIPGLSPSIVQPWPVNPDWWFPKLPPRSLFYNIPLVGEFTTFATAFHLMQAGGFTSVSQGLVPAARALLATKRKDQLMGERKKNVLIVLSDGTENVGFLTFTRLVASGFCQSLKAQMVGKDEDPRDFQMAYIGTPRIDPITFIQYNACFGPENVYIAPATAQIRDRVLTIMSKATDSKLYYRFGKVYGE